MVLNNSFEINEIAGEYLVIPMGEATKSFNGIIAVNEAAAFLLKQMKVSRSYDELVALLIANFNVKRDVAERDVFSFIEKLSHIGVIKK